MRALLGDAQDPGRGVAVEHGDVLGHGDLPHRIVELGQLDVPRPAVGVVELFAGHGEAGTELHEGQHAPSGRRHAFGGAGHLVDPAQVGGRVPPAVRPGQVDQFAGGQMGDEAALRLRLDLGPRGLGDRGELAVEVVHHSLPFRLPMPSEPTGPIPIVPPSASASTSTSVTGSVVKR